MEKLELLTRALLAAHHHVDEIPRLVEEHLPTARVVTALSGEQSVTIKTPDGRWETPATAKWLSEKTPPAPAPKSPTNDEKTIAHMAARRQARVAPSSPPVTADERTRAFIEARRKRRQS